MRSTSRSGIEFTPTFIRLIAARSMLAIGSEAITGERIDTVVTLRPGKNTFSHDGVIKGYQAGRYRVTVYQICAFAAAAGIAGMGSASI